MRNKIQQKIKQHESYLRNKEIILNRNSLRRKERKLWFNELTKNNKCLRCGYSEFKEALDYHHVNPLEKDTEISTLLGELRSKQRIIEELNKCVCLCSNCHRGLHRKHWNLDDLNNTGTRKKEIRCFWKAETLRAVLRFLTNNIGVPCSKVAKNLCKVFV